jgi:hypothetical protein
VINLGIASNFVVVDLKCLADGNSRNTGQELGAGIGHMVLELGQII